MSEELRGVTTTIQVLHTYHINMKSVTMCDRLKHTDVKRNYLRQTKHQPLKRHVAHSSWRHQA
jgi:hypothetical protein